MHKRYKLFVLIPFVGLSISNPSVTYAASFAESSIDWSNLKIEFLSGAGTFNITQASESYRGDVGVWGAGYSIGGMPSVSLGFMQNETEATAGPAQIKSVASAKYSNDYYGDYYSHASWTGVFGSLGGGAKVSISVPYSLKYVTDSWSISGSPDYAMANATLTLSVGEGLTSSRSLLHDSSVANSELTKNEHGWLSITYLNNLDSPLNFGVQGMTYAIASTSYVAPVPEPETYSMLLAGLGLIGAMARRRKPSTTA